MADICVGGRLQKGTPCWYLQADDGQKLFLIGDLSSVREGDHVVACGAIAKATLCGEGEVLSVNFISKDIAGKPALPKLVQRNIEVTITRSSADDSPEFRLEGQGLPLSANGAQWRGSYRNVTVEVKLEIFFNSEAWPKQVFVAAIDAVDPGDATKKWSQNYQFTASNGHAVLAQSMDVGAADATSGAIA